ncbi:hypothetical protein BJ912DRAFT_1064280 [Pholiota molesta]|nr:hypothetical protein BJ912DRAFT_1064280 [Pholiota molesta]
MHPPSTSRSSRNSAGTGTRPPPMANIQATQGRHGDQHTTSLASSTSPSIFRHQHPHHFRTQSRLRTTTTWKVTARRRPQLNHPAQHSRERRRRRGAIVRSAPWTPVACARPCKVRAPYSIRLANSQSAAAAIDDNDIRAFELRFHDGRGGPIDISRIAFAREARWDRLRSLLGAIGRLCTIRLANSQGRRRIDSYRIVSALEGAHGSGYIALGDVRRRLKSTTAAAYDSHKLTPHPAAVIDVNDELRRLALDSCKGRRRIAFALEGVFEARGCGRVGLYLGDVQFKMRAPCSIQPANSQSAGGGHRRQPPGRSLAPQRTTTTASLAYGSSAPTPNIVSPPTDPAGTAPPLATKPATQGRHGEQDTTYLARSHLADAALNFRHPAHPPLRTLRLNPPGAAPRSTTTTDVFAPESAFAAEYMPCA